MDWIGTAFLLTGFWLIGSKNHHGFIISISGCLFWAAYGLSQELPSVTAVNLVFAVVNARSWWKWRAAFPHQKTNR